MTYLLAIETATKVCSAALFKDDELLAVKEEKGDFSHAKNLAVFTDLLLKESAVASNDLSGVIVSKGPGSYTGLRIGVSFAKGLCYALKIPLISIDTLHALALGFTETKKDSFDLICPMIDARRMEVYASIFNNSLETVKPISADVIQSGSYSELIKDQSIVFIGDGAEKCKTLLMAEKRTFVTDFLPSAAYLGKEGFRKFKKTETENVAYFEPFYLKEFIALKGKKLV